MSTGQIIGFAVRGISGTFGAFGIFMFLYRKHHGRIRPYLTGILTLMILAVPRKIISDLLIPPEGEWAFRTAVSILIGAFCEEIGRYFAFRYALTEYNRVTDAFCYGLGHGGMELFALAQYPWEFFLAGTGLISENPERLQMISEISFLDSMEVLLFDDCTAIAVHIACSVLIYSSVRYEKKNYFLISFLMHSLINIITLYFGVAGSALGTAVLCYLAYQLYNKNKNYEVF